MKHKKLIWNGSGGFSGVVCEDYVFEKGKAVEVPEDVADRILANDNTAFKAVHTSDFVPANAARAEDLPVSSVIEKLDKTPSENKMEKDKGENK